MHCLNKGPVLKVNARSCRSGFKSCSIAYLAAACPLSLTLRYTSDGMTPLQSAYEMDTPVPLQDSVGTDAAWARMVDPICTPEKKWRG